MGWWNTAMDFLSTEAPEVRNARAARLAELKTIVAKHVADYARVGAALAEIQQNELFRLEHRTFEDFVRQEWDMSRQHADRLIKAAETARVLTPTGSIPRTERLARPLAALPAADRIDAWQEANELAGNDPVRPEHVAAAVTKRRSASSKPAKRPKLIRLRVPGCKIVLEPTKGYTSTEDALTYALQQIRTAKAA